MLALVNAADSDYGYEEADVFLDYRDNPYVTVAYVPAAGLSFDSTAREGQALVLPKVGVVALFPSQANEYRVEYNNGTAQAPSYLPLDPDCFSLRPANEQGALRLSVQYNHFNIDYDPSRGSNFPYLACQSCGRDYFVRVGFKVAGDAVERRYYLHVPFSIPCAADVTLVTVKDGGLGFGVGIDVTAPTASIGGREVILADAIASYITHLRAGGKKVAYVELDTLDAQESFGYTYPYNPAPSMESETAAKRLVAPIRKVLQKTRSSYLVLLGGVDVIPMPFHSDEGAPGAYFASRDGKVPSDDLYAMRADGQIPEVIVARLPSYLDYSPPITSMIMSGLSAQPIPDDFTLVSVVGDSCGAVADCFIREDVEYVSQTFFGRSCEDEEEATGHCRLTPTFCKYARQGSEVVEGACSLPLPMEEFKHKLGLVFLLHGSGASFGASSSSEPDPVLASLFGQEERYHVVLESMDFENTAFTGAPAVFSTACYGGAIDVTQARPTLVIYFAEAGARAVVGHTRLSWGAGPAYFDLIKQFFTSTSKTLGQRVREYKRAGYAQRQARVDAAIAQLRADSAALGSTVVQLEQYKTYLEADNWEDLIPSLVPAYYRACWMEELLGQGDARSCVRRKLDDAIEDAFFRQDFLQSEISDIERHSRRGLTLGEKQAFSDVEALVLYGDPTQTSAG
ncbi:MAG: hypothetical protein AB1626_00005 [Candidatus Micrarchaeota archaeon]